MNQLIAFIRLGRPLFLVGGVILHALGVAIALSSGAHFNLAALIVGQIAISAPQWMTHYANDYFDLAADRANPTPTHWSGGSRVLPNGLLAPEVAHVTAIFFGCIAVSAALVLAFVVHTGVLTLPLLLLAICLAWFYSAPPIRLHSRGLGELTTALLVPTLTPLTGYYLQAGRLDWLPLLTVFPLACLQFCMLLAIEFPDAAGDSMVGKWTLVVRLGEVKAIKLYQSVLLSAYCSLPLLLIFSVPLLPVLAIALMSPLALLQIWNARHLQPKLWNRFAFFSVALLIGSAAVEALAFVLLVGIR